MLNPLNQQILELHSQYSETIDKMAKVEIPNYEFFDVVPMFYDDTRFENSNLFIGINPSLNAIYNNQINNISTFSNLIRSDNNAKSEIVESLIKHQHQLMGSNSQDDGMIQYFRYIHEFHNELKANLKWSHYDLFSFRLTDQNIALRILREPELKEYVKLSINRFLYLIKTYKFNSIIVLNSEVTRYFIQHSDEFHLTNESLFISPYTNNPYDAGYGHYLINNGASNVSLFLFKQLSGGGTTRDEKSSFIEFVRENS